MYKKIKEMAKVGILAGYMTMNAAAGQPIEPIEILVNPVETDKYIAKQIERRSGTIPKEGVIRGYVNQLMNRAALDIDTWCFLGAHEYEFHFGTQDNLDLNHLDETANRLLKDERLPRQIFFSHISQSGEYSQIVREEALSRIKNPKQRDYLAEIMEKTLEGKTRTAD